MFFDTPAIDCYIYDLSALFKKTISLKQNKLMAKTKQNKNKTNKT